jgi:hypothetical protein
VVTNFDGEFRVILKALGTHWDPVVRDFSQRIGGTFRTPSDVQLTLGLRTTGIGQWRRFAEALAPVSLDLAPWVSYFGYEL